MNIQATRQSDDLLSQERWTFYFDVPLGGKFKFYLQYYSAEVRQSRRHRTWEKKRFYSRFKVREYNLISYADVPMPNDVIADAKNQLKAMIDRMSLIKAED